MTISFKNALFILFVVLFSGDCCASTNDRVAPHNGGCNRQDDTVRCAAPL